MIKKATASNMSTTQTRPPSDAASPDGTGRFAALASRFKHVKSTIVAIAGIGAVASGLVGYYNTYQTVTLATTAASPSSAAVDPLSILVLPFINQTGDEKKTYIADALTTSLTADLARIENAVVISPATAATFKGKTLTVPQMGKDASVRFVLQGSVLSSGNNVRVTFTLAETQFGATLWTDTLDGDLGNLFALQDKVTGQIANGIGREMVIVAARDSEKRRSTPKVADLFLRADALGMKPQTQQISQQRESLYRQVLTLEPSSIRAMAALTNSLIVQAGNFAAGLDPAAREGKYEEARSLALAIQKQEPNNPAIFDALSFYALAHDDFLGALRTREAQLALYPRDKSVVNDMAYISIYGAEPERAITFINQAISLDPKHPQETHYVIMARAHAMMGDDEAAITACLKSLDLNPTFPSCYPILAMAYAAKGDLIKANAAKAELLRLYPRFVMPVFAKPKQSSPAAYKAYFDTKFLPMWRKAGLPE